jgi:hypothetical protein
MTDETVARVSRVLDRTDRAALRAHAVHAPAWMRTALRQISDAA